MPTPESASAHPEEGEIEDGELDNLPDPELGTYQNLRHLTTPSPPTYYNTNIICYCCMTYTCT